MGSHKKLRRPHRQLYAGIAIGAAFAFPLASIFSADAASPPSQVQAIIAAQAALASAQADLVQATAAPVATATATAKPSASATASPTIKATPAPTPTTTSIGAVTAGAGRLFGTASLWNTVKAGVTFATAANSTLSSAQYGINNSTYSDPVYFAKATDPVTTFHLGAGWGFPAATITTPAPAGMVPQVGSDHVLDVQLTNGQLLDMYGVTGSGTSFTASVYGISDGVAGTGFGVQPAKAIGVTAIGAPTAGGVILARDVAAGVISHALHIAFNHSQLGGIGTSGTAFVPPAVHADDAGGTGPLMEGGLLLIPPTTPMPAGLDAGGQMLWRAAQTYGVYVMDQLSGSVDEFSGDGSAAVSKEFTSSDFSTVGKALELVKTW